MSEYLLESGKGGSIANVAYSPCGVSSTSQLLYKEFLNNLFQRGERCLGRAVFAARCSVIASYPDDDSIYGPAVLWTLFGDPALRIRHTIQNGIEESLKPQAPSRDLTVSPNPCDGSTTIRLSSPLPTPYSLFVYDASGRIVYSQPVRASSFVIRTSPFPAGVYVARCVSGVHCQTGASLANSASARFLVRH
jgi:hypothetical protein